MAYPFAFSTLRNAALVLACAALSACSYVLLPPNVQHVAPPSKSLVEAERKLADATAQRAAIEAEFAASEQVCYSKFFVNSCLENSREKRREALAVVRSVEVEAELFQRRDKANARDRALAETLKEAEAEAAQRAANPRPVPEEEQAPPPKPIASKVNREAENAAKLKRIAEQERAEAGKRAENVARFEKKRQESERRQAERAKRQAEREAEKN
jgi:colicin import membrane protein